MYPHNSSTTCLQFGALAGNVCFRLSHSTTRIALYFGLALLVDALLVLHRLLVHSLQTPRLLAVGSHDAVQFTFVAALGVVQGRLGPLHVLLERQHAGTACGCSAGGLAQFLGQLSDTLVVLRRRCCSHRLLIVKLLPQAGNLGFDKWHGDQIPHHVRTVLP